MTSHPTRTFSRFAVMLICQALLSGSLQVLIGRQPASLSEPHCYTDGLAVAVTEIAHGRLIEIPYSDDPSVQIGDAYSIVTITLHNGSDHTFEAWFIGRMTYGSPRREAGRFASRTVTDEQSVQVLAPGATSSPYGLGFLIPADGRDDVVFELTIDAGEHETAVFAGPLQVTTTAENLCRATS
ncbi:MAG TPA: hypothetical protein VFP89_16130 [Propionibacteriaceae bacterium]|nr:hypothetical protein [Propionibacteriaceae bacterium]